MPFTSGIKFKMQLLLVSSITLALALVGASLSYFIERYHFNAAQNSFTRTFAVIGEELGQREAQLKSVAAGLARRDDIIASVNMIYQYSSPGDYDPLIYDAEKRRLVQTLRNQANVTGISQLAVYDGRGGLMVFYRAEPVVSGHTSFQRGHMLLYRQDGGDQWMEGELPSTVAPRRAQPGPAMTASFVRMGRGFAIEVAAPILRQYPDGSAVSVGQVVTTDFIGESFVDLIRHKTNTDFAVLFDDGSRLGGLNKVVVGQLSGAPALRATAESQGVAAIAHPDYFLTARLLPLANGAKAYLVAAIERNVVSAEAEHTELLLLLVLLLSALIMVPLGTWVAGRTVSAPVRELISSLDAIERGDYERRAVVNRKDELGRLANAFNEMAATIKNREQALQDSERKYRLLVDNLPQSIFHKNTDSVYVSCNKQYADQLGIAPEEIVGKDDFDFFPVELAEEYRAIDREVMRTRQINEREEPFVRDGKTYYIHTVKTPLQDEQGRIIGILGIFRDVTEHREILAQQRQAAAVFESTAEGVMVVDVGGHIVAVNRAFSSITGYAESEVLGQNPRLLHVSTDDDALYQSIWPLVHQTGQWQGETQARRKSGESFPEWLTVSAVRDERGAVTHYVMVFTDITVLKRSQEQLDHLAHHDPLTDLPNRVLFNMRLTYALSHARRNDQRVGVLFLDLDRFKNVNDTLGHPVGDALLQQVAQRFRVRMRDADTIARTGGDEFIVIAEELGSPDDAAQVAQKLLDSFSVPFRVGSSDIHLGASIGISLFPEDGPDVETLVKNADIAMYRAKDRGRNNYQFYTSELTTNAMEKFRLEAALRHALERDELVLYYQPKVRLSDGAVFGVEALLRWRNTELGLVTPDRFIPMAEDTALIIPIGEWVMLSACRQMRSWLEMGLPLQQVAVNLSGVQILRGNVVGTVARALEESGLDPRHLELEITESVLMEHAEETIRVLDELRGLGVSIAVDDFGTGYSSLSYLKRFPIDALKIDRSFVQDLPADQNDEAIVRAVIALGRSLQLGIIAEGVETVAQRDFLLREGCDSAQGYLYSKPVPASWISEHLQSGTVVAGDA